MTQEARQRVVRWIIDVHDRWCNPKLVAVAPYIAVTCFTIAWVVTILLR